MFGLGLIAPSVQASLGSRLNSVSQSNTALTVKDKASEGLEVGKEKIAEHYEKKGALQEKNRIATNLLQLNLTRGQVAEATGLSVNTIAALAKTNNPKKKSWFSLGVNAIENGHIKQGATDECEKIATNLVNMKIPTAKIAEATGMSFSEIKALQTIPDEKK